jgi:hypothetical protein
MHMLLVATLALTVSPAVADAEPATLPRTASELREAVHASLSAEAQAPGRDDRLRAVAELVRCYGELKTNENLAYRDRIRLRAKIRNRLGRVASDMEQQFARSGSADQSNSPSQPAGADGGQGVDDPEKALIELIESTIRPPSWEPHGGRGVIARGVPGAPVAGRAGWGGGGGFGGGMGGGGLGNAKAEQAEALIELIRSTIRPDSWDVNGGRGTIMYWPGS